MNENPLYPELNQLFGVYLNEDCSYWGSTIEAIVGCYKGDRSTGSIKGILVEIESFWKADSYHLDAAFEEANGSQFDPKLWTHRTASFLDELKRLLNA
ncbi:contact-dependent growth inhibition system immunity protein [Paraburkholderia sp. BR13444]|uniref:contact-dependent growth inhibition system immunity protein n=1 Tax=Paraburkholderia sp. BR13444 TaxID=3236997 RepID=UPI0034CF3698